MDLKGKTFIVTGGGSGLGEATARAFAAGGANVMVADLNDAAGEKVAGDLGANGAYANCDVSSEEAVAACVEAAVSKFGGLNGAVNCAGIGAAMRVAGKHGPHALDLFQTIINVNLVGSFNVIRLCAPKVIEAAADEKGERGVFINTASVAAYEGQIGQAAYSASKGGVVSMTLPIAREFAQFGIRVVTIAPGLFDTPMFAMLPQDARDSLGAQVPFPSRLGFPEEFADMACQIVHNTMLNGTTVRLDGAVRMQPK